MVGGGGVPGMEGESVMLLGRIGFIKKKKKSLWAPSMSILLRFQGSQ